MNRFAALALTMLAGVPAGGCISGSLATSTGPRPDGNRWSVESKQKVHAGEKVEFDFVLLDAWGHPLRPDDVADYAVLLVGDERYQIESDLYGHFTFAHQFEGGRPGESVRVTAVAFRENGIRDFMNIGGEWAAADSPDDAPDSRVARDSIVLDLYQSAVELGLDVPADDLSPNTGVLEIRRDDGATRLIYPAAPGKPGFDFDRGDDGKARVRYVPRADEVSTAGPTQAEFRINDRTGRVHRASSTIETP